MTYNRPYEIFRTLGTDWNYYLSMIVPGTSEAGVTGNTRDFEWSEE